MANEAVIVEKLGNQGEVVDFTVANGTGISKGTLMSGGDLRSAVASIARAEQDFCGISSAEKEAGDGAVNLGLYTKVIADCYSASGGAIAAGQLVVLSGANLLRAAVAADVEAGKIVGKALENVAAGTQEVFEVAIGVFS